MPRLFILWNDNKKREGLWKTATEIINAYTRGELTLEECNAKLGAIGSSLMLGPNRCKLTPEMAANVLLKGKWYEVKGNKII